MPLPGQRQGATLPLGNLPRNTHVQSMSMQHTCADHENARMTQHQIHASCQQWSAACQLHARHDCLLLDFAGAAAPHKADLQPCMKSRMLSLLSGVHHGLQNVGQQRQQA